MIIFHIDISSVIKLFALKSKISLSVTIAISITCLFSNYIKITIHFTHFTLPNNKYVIMIENID